MASDARSTGTATWSYDNADQLKTLTDTSTSGNSTWGYDVAHELTSLVKKTGTTTNQNLTLGYNVEGDRTQQVDSVNSTTTTFGYDQADRLTSYTKGATSASYSYNGDGLRVSKKVGSTTTGQVWDVAEGLPLLLQDGSTSYVTGPGGLPLEQVNGNKPSYYYQDQLGSTRGILDSRGSTLATYTYDPYGNLKSSTGTISDPFQYAGQFTDSESGLQYLRARYYDPGTAQFVTVDPMTGTTGEPYAYGADTPVNLVDPTGRIVWELGFAVAGAIVGGGLDALTQYEQNCGSFNNFNWGEFLGAAAGGAVIGATVGTGVGGEIDAGAGAADAGGETVIPTRFVGTDKPWTRGATPNSIYTHVDPVTGVPKQNAVYDENGDVIGHVDFKQHGSAPPGHGHIFPEPGNPASGHGPGAPHIPPGDLPPGWGDLP
jgi:RHS repeat-associated protein